MFLFEALPFHLTFEILFRHGGFDSMESVLGTHACWEFQKLMGFTRRADLLCICRAVQLLDHPAHALFLLNYPPDSSIPENRRAWRVAEKCSIGWGPDARSVVLAMRVFAAAHPVRQVFPWLNTADLMKRARSEEEWVCIGHQQSLGYKFTEWWWNGQREAFHLERAAAKSDMGAAVKEKATAEMQRLLGALKRRQTIAAKEEKAQAAWVRMKRAEEEAKIKESNRGGKRQKKDVVEPPAPPYVKPPAVVLTSGDKKKVDEGVKAKHIALQSVLESVRRALSSVDPRVFKEKLGQFAKLVAALEIKNPLIRWSLRQLLHVAAERTGWSVWDTEFVMQPYQWAAVEKPLETLVALAKRQK